MGEIARGRRQRAPAVGRRAARTRAARKANSPAPFATAAAAATVPRTEWAVQCAGLVGIALLTAWAASPEPPGPLVVGGYLAVPADLASPLFQAAPADREPPRLAPRLLGETHLAIAPALGPPEPQPSASAAADLAPLPAPRKPSLGGRRVWIPAPKPSHEAPAEEAVATIWPSPPKPTSVSAAWPSPSELTTAIPPYPAKPTALAPLAVAPAAAPAGDDSIRVEHGPANRDLGPDETIRVADRATSLRALEGAAREALRGERPGEALELYEQVQVLSPRDRAASLGRAAALWQLGRQSEAVAVYRTLLEANPGDLSAKISLLGLIAEDAPEEALRGLGQLARQHPKDGRIAARTAMILARQDRLDQAVVELRRAVTLEPSDPTYWANLGILLDRAGRIDQAIVHYRTALRLATETGTSSIRLDAISTRLEHLSARPPH